jgi:hypothetical protein
MRRCAKSSFAALAVLCLVPALADGQLDTVQLAGTATKLSSLTYFAPPNDQKIQVRLTGAEMSPLSESTYDVRRLRIEYYYLDGKPQAVAEAPQCIYAPFGTNTASSAGHLELKLNDGKINVQGDGFSWRQKERFLVISNHLITTFKSGTWKLPTL